MPLQCIASPPSPPPFPPPMPPFECCPGHTKPGGQPHSCGDCELDLPGWMLSTILGTCGLIVICMLGSRMCLARKHMASLAYHSGWKLSLVISLFCIGAHVLLGYAQLSGHDCNFGFHGGCPQPPHANIPAGILRGIVTGDLEYKTAGALTAAVSAITAAECYEHDVYVDCALGVPPELALLNLSRASACYALECGGASLTVNLVQVSYDYSVTKLFYQPGWSDGEAPGGSYPGRAAGVVLFFWSFLWPHIKLAAMHLAFYLPLPTGVRRNIFFWLALLGKWSLTDPLLSCAPHRPSCPPTAHPNPELVCPSALLAAPSSL
jgi:hypothetical protein